MSLSVSPMEIVDICERIGRVIVLCKERGSRLREFQTCARH